MDNEKQKLLIYFKIKDAKNRKNVRGIDKVSNLFEIFSICSVKEIKSHCPTRFGDFFYWIVQFIPCNSMFVG